MSSAWYIPINKVKHLLLATGTNALKAITTIATTLLLIHHLTISRIQNNFCEQTQFSTNKTFGTPTIQCYESFWTYHWPGV